MMGAEEIHEDQDIKRRMAEIEDRFDTQYRKLVRGNRIVLIVGLILAIVIVSYLNYVVSQFGGYVAEPETVAELVLAPADEQLGQMLQQLEGQAAEQAPVLVADARKHLMQRLPELRRTYGQRVVRLLVKEIGTSVRAELHDIVGDAIQEHKEVLGALIDEAAKPDGGDELTRKVRAEFGNDMQTWTDQELVPVRQRLAEYRAYVNRLRTADNLTPVEKAEKEWLIAGMIFITDALEQASEDPFGEKKN